MSDTKRSEFDLLEMENQMKLFKEKYMSEPRAAIDHAKGAFTLNVLAWYALVMNKAYEEKNDD